MREIKIAQLEIPAIMYFGPECYVLVVGLYFKADSDSILMITFFLGPFLLSRILWARLLQMSWECGSLVLQQRSMPGRVVGSGGCLCNEGFHGTACEMCEPGRYGKDCKSGNIYEQSFHSTVFR